jgi:hypothetical protein
MTRLESWSLVGLDGATPLAIRGAVHGDHRFSDGTPITSPRLTSLDPAGRFAWTRSHIYELGTISDAFARWMTNEGRTLVSLASTLHRNATSNAPD